MILKNMMQLMNTDDVNSRKARKNCLFVLSDFSDRKYFLNLKLETLILTTAGNLTTKHFANAYFHSNNIFIVMEF